MRSISHQMKVARFPIHRDLAGFDFSLSKVDAGLIKQLAKLDFSDTAQNVDFFSSGIRTRHIRRIFSPFSSKARSLNHSAILLLNIGLRLP